MPDGVGLEDIARRAAELGTAAGCEGAWLVGGAVRDHLLGRPVDDWDLVVDGDPRAAAVTYARRSGGSPFPLSERHGAWRVVEGRQTVDFTRQTGALEEDLRRRDFTVNAIAVSTRDGRVVDPLDGLGDLHRRSLRVVADRAFRDDPLRLLRLPRLASELEFDVEPDSAHLAVRDAHLADRAAGERQLAELSRIIGARDPISALALCDRLGVLAATLPEIHALHGVEQNRFHHLDVFDHTLHVLDSTADIASNLGHYFPRDVAGTLEEALAGPLDASMDQRAGLRWAALFHDVAKPQTRTETPVGAKFFGHDQQGAAIADAVLARLRAGSALRRFCSVLVREHLRLGFLVRHRPLDPRLVYRYALATRPYAPASIVLSLGDRLATRGELTRLRGLRRHHELAHDLARALRDLGAVPPAPVIRGDTLAEAIGLEPGPLLGELVAVLGEEQAAGAVVTAGAAIDFGREWLRQRPGLGEPRV